jgi:Na+-translocating ferredoxin:NAD+ oxidoreductase RnfA subunit
MYTYTYTPHERRQKKNIVYIKLLGTCPCVATEHKLRPFNGLRALATGGVSTIVTAKSMIKRRYRTI